MGPAKKAWGSHIIAYTTHVVVQEGMFDHKALHYGYLAKIFGIRDAPGDIRVRGGGATVGGKWRGNTTGSAATITSGCEMKLGCGRHTGRCRPRSSKEDAEECFWHADEEEDGFRV